VIVKVIIPTPTDVSVVPTTSMRVGLTMARGPQGPQGERGVDGTPGGSFVFNQIATSAHWVVTHGLNFFPAVTALDSAGSMIAGDVHYVDANTVEVYFSTPSSGTLYLS